MTKRIKIIFTISVLLNLILIGGVAGNFYKHHHWKHIPDSVSEHAHEALKENMKVSWAEMRQNFQDMRQKKKDLKEIIEAETFNLEAYDELTKQILNYKNEMSHRKAVIMGKALSELSLEDRKLLSQKIVKGITLGPKKGGKHRKQNRDKNSEKHINQ